MISYTKAKQAIQEADYSSLMCKAHGCPNAWSVDHNKLCTAHAWEPSHKWPAITERVTDRIVAKQNEARKPVRPVSDAEKREIISNLRQLLKGQRT